MAELTNTVTTAGLYDGILTGLTDAVTIQLVEGLTLTKSADKDSWADGILTYTIIIDNTSDTAYTGVSITDMLDYTKVALIADTVLLDGVAANYTYDDLTGELIIIPDESLIVAAEDSATITFQVQKV